MNPKITENDAGWEPCSARWYADESLAWTHRCFENGEHDVCRCCCGAEKPRES